MKSMIREFSELLALCLMMIGLALAFFSLLINVYHQKTISRTENVDFDKYVMRKKTDASIKNIEDYINKTDVEKILVPGKKFYVTSVKIAASRCLNYIKDSSFYTNSGIVKIGYPEVYKEAVYFYNQFYNKCLVAEISSLPAVAEKNEYVDKYISDAISIINILNTSINNNGDYVVRTLLGNSSYNYVTDVSRETIYNGVKDSYDVIATNYVSSMQIVELIAKHAYDLVEEETE